MKSRHLRLIDEFTNTVKEPKRKKSSKALKSFHEMGIPSDRVAPGAPNPPMMSRGGKVKKPKMRHGQY